MRMQPQVTFALVVDDSQDQILADVCQNKIPGRPVQSKNNSCKHHSHRSCAVHIHPAEYMYSECTFMEPVQNRFEVVPWL
jgi:hypothetical protein